MALSLENGSFLLDFFLSGQHDRACVCACVSPSRTPERRKSEAGFSIFPENKPPVPCPMHGAGGLSALGRLSDTNSRYGYARPGEVSETSKENRQGVRDFCLRHLRVWVCGLGL